MEEMEWKYAFDEKKKLCKFSTLKKDLIHIFLNG